MRGREYGAEVLPVHLGGGGWREVRRHYTEMLVRGLGLKAKFFGLVSGLQGLGFQALVFNVLALV